MNSLELFAGCGGLALGISEAGFKHRLIVEVDPHACSTISLNKNRQIKHVVDWPLLQSDVRLVDYSTIGVSSIDLVSGGPPCQPFSIGGSHKGPQDKRNMWPEAIRCIREVRPKGFIFENVKGLLRPAFARYLRYLLLQLSFPDIIKHENETEAKYFSRLINHEKKGCVPAFKVLVHDINTADYGAAQKRNRALIIGVQTGLASNFTFPPKTHSREALIWSKYKSYEYWQGHNISKRRRTIISMSDQKILTKLEMQGTPIEKPWVTVRDIISDLPSPQLNCKSISNHEYHSGARIYTGHTGSILDEPAKALKAGAHGVPGGENILVQENGSVRYFTIREMARLQGLPDDYHISGTWVNSIKQLGNAVPVQIGTFFGKQMLKMINPVSVTT